jgi:amino acid permease
MDCLYLICSFSWIIVAFAFYKIHKLWHKDVTEIDKLYKFQIKAGNFKAWLVIIICVIAAIVYFFKSIG